MRREILHSVPFDYAPFEAQGKQGKQNDTGGERDVAFAGGFQIVRWGHPSITEGSEVGVSS
jgi:hypothetical protein